MTESLSEEKPRLVLKIPKVVVNEITNEDTPAACELHETPGAIKLKISTKVLKEESAKEVETLEIPNLDIKPIKVSYTDNDFGKFKPFIKFKHQTHIYKY